MDQFFVSFHVIICGKLAFYRRQPIGAGQKDFFFEVSGHFKLDVCEATEDFKIE